MLFNSIITTYRDRPKSLQIFLDSLKLAAKKVKKESFEIIITELGNSKASKIISRYSSDLNIKHLKIDYKSIFWKTKALNHCVLNSSGNFITMIDVDALVTQDFLKGIVEFYSNPAKYKTKLAHRVRFLGSKETSQAFTAGVTDSLINGFIKRHKTLRFARERYTEKEMMVSRPDQLRRNDRQKLINTKALGNSHFTMRKEDYMAIGGYDERFIGWACEDLDFNLRAYKYLGGGQIREDLKYLIFSCHHSRNKDWFVHNKRRENS
ncbi:MAG: glycosyltransferase, partial [Clostridiales bacterium]|nr:glycosyltransferase [Clostridiales bacterium]